MSKQYSEISPSEPTADAYTTILSARKAEINYQHKNRRYIRKDGNCRVLFRHVPKEWQMYITDIFTTLVEVRWRFMFLMFALSYILSWLFFGLLYWVITLANSDMSTPCVYEVNDFTGAFLFSLETQTTIGYGFRGMSENCMVAIIVVTVQDVLSCFIDTFVIGIAVAKMASARRRAQTVGFSNCAVINLRNGRLCLSWRIGDFRRHHMVEGVAQAQVIRRIQESAGRLDIIYKDLEIKQSNIILAIPTTVFHIIEPGSPLYSMSLEDLRRDDFELVVSFTYTDDSTGILHQTRTSYTPEEILWGQLFQEMLIVNQRYYKVDYSMFHHTAKVLVPEVSAEEYEKMKCCRLTSHSLHPMNPAFDPKPPSANVDLVNGTTEPEVHVATVAMDTFCEDH
ncbi:inward rectifier potassium channel 16 [Esox lucius]|uniref:Potassium inwardly rectifying channel subfamily J member 16 n=1 Tax=Esox lucius TaxID=8010 RepID=A0A6Q2Z0T0_ESOLU|nr:inward rectifier potassium channel 16 [Esox lucius]XP_010897808.2 inward rectifier potassium channel 16 [Esox lucius]XP_019902673.2 inward rectifier potassium channel 16 [Esox lucius]XP_034148493.1 inward rectifier potassium channel 16 [Esox lucius]